MTEPALQPSTRPDAGPAGTANGPSPSAPDRRPPGDVRDPGGRAPDGREQNSDGQACTQAQLRRFIKSRPYVPMHELRRRFGLNGSDDDVSPVDIDGRRLFVGLPPRESGLLGELLRQGDVGYELLLDPVSPIVIGVFPMRPVQRP
jgi:hypothetical protein